MRSIVQCRFSDSLCEGEGGCVWALIARALVTVIAIHDIRGAFSVVPFPWCLFRGAMHKLAAWW